MLLLVWQISLTTLFRALLRAWIYQIFPKWHAAQLTNNTWLSLGAEAVGILDSLISFQRALILCGKFEKAKFDIARCLSLLCICLQYTFNITYSHCVHNKVAFDDINVTNVPVKIKETLFVMQMKTLLAYHIWAYLLFTLLLAGSVPLLYQVFNLQFEYYDRTTSWIHLRKWLDSKRQHIHSLHPGYQCAPLLIVPPGAPYGGCKKMYCCHSCFCLFFFFFCNVLPCTMMV